MKTLLSIVRGLVVEIADEVRASRNETTNRHEGNMSTKNTKLTDSVSMMRAANAKLAALVGDTSRVSATLSDARQLAAELSMPVRRAS